MFGSNYTKLRNRYPVTLAIQYVRGFLSVKSVNLLIKELSITDSCRYGIYSYLPSCKSIYQINGITSNLKCSCNQINDLLEFNGYVYMNIQSCQYFKFSLVSLKLKGEIIFKLESNTDINFRFNQNICIPGGKIEFFPQKLNYVINFCNYILCMYVFFLRSVAN